MTCSVCGDDIRYQQDWRGRIRFWHVLDGRCGFTTLERYERHVQLGCFNRALPKEDGA